LKRHKKKDGKLPVFLVKLAEIAISPVLRKGLAEFEVAFTNLKDRHDRDFVRKMREKALCRAERLRHGTASAGQGGTEIAVISRVAFELTSNGALEYTPLG